MVFRKKQIKLTAFLMTLLMLIGMLPPVAFAVGGETSVPGQNGEFVVPISAHAEVTVSGTTHATTFDALASYLQKTELFTAPKYEEYPALPIGMAVYYDATDADADGIADAVERGRAKDYHIFNSSDGTKPKRDVIVYAVNYVGERLGQENDVSILTDYIEDGYVVLVADFNCDTRAGSPNIEHSMAGLGNYYGGSGNAGSEVCGVLTNGAYFYYLPSGYRLARNVWYWNSYYYSSLGTRQSMVNAWNRCMDSVEPKGANNHQTYKYNSDFTLSFDVKKADGTVETVTRAHTAGEAIDSVTYVEECVRKDGSPLRYDCYIDILYPSQPNKATPVYSMAATSPNRHTNTCEVERCTFTGFTFSGYTTVTFDYVYVPMVHDDAYGYIDSYGTHAQNILKSAQAAMRCVRYYAKDYGYDATLIGVGGISKGSPAAAALSIIDNELTKEPNIYTQDSAARTTFGVASAYEGDIVLSDTERLTLQQPFLYYDVPYGPIYNADGSVSKDIYGNVITYDYYGDDGVQYVRAAAEGDNRTANHYDTDLGETDAGFRTASGTTVAADYRTAIDARAATDTFTYAAGYTSPAGDATLTLTRTYGTDDPTLMSVAANEFESYYSFVDSDANCVYASAGDGVNRYTSGTALGGFKKVPMIICCGSYDPYGCFDYWYAIRDSFGENAAQPAVNPYFPIPMMDQGHTYPTGYDYAHGFWRHDAFLEFFNHFMKAEEYNYPEVIWSTPVAGSDTAKTDTTVEVKFYTEMDVSTVTAGMTLTDSHGTAVPGTVTSDEYNTLFTFIPADGLKPGETYTLKVAAASTKDADGQALPADYVRSFTVTEFNSFVAPVADGYVSSGSKDTAYHANSLYRYILKADSSNTSYVTFRKADISDKTALRFETVYQSNKSGVSFDVYVVDNCTVEHSSLTYNTRPANQTLVGTVTTDANGYGFLSIANLGLSKEGDATFVIVPKNGASLMLESEDSAERGPGVIAVGEADVIRPVADAYVSPANPAANYGSATQLLVGGSADDSKIAFLSYNIEAVAGRDIVKLSIPSVVTVGGSVRVLVLPGVTIDETALTYANMPSLDNAIPVGSVSFAKSGTMVIDLSSLMLDCDDVTFVFVVSTEGDISSQDFTNATGKYESATTGNSFSATKVWRVGGEQNGSTVIADPADASNLCFRLRTKAASARSKFYNVLSTTRNLTGDDVGRTFRITFRVKVSADYVSSVGVKYGFMQEIGSAFAGPFEYVIPTTDWQTVEFVFTVTQSMIDSANPYLFCTETGGNADSYMYIDDITCEDIAASVAIGSKDGAETSSNVMLVSGTASRLAVKPIAETVVSKSQPTTAFGGLRELTVNTDKTAFLTFNVEDLKDAPMVLTLPVTDTDKSPVRVWALDRAINPDTFTYETYQTLLDSRIPVGTISQSDSAEIAVTPVMANISGDVVTFVLERVGYDYTQDYESMSSVSTTPSVAPTVVDGVVTAWNDVVIYQDESDGVVRYRYGYNASPSDISLGSETGNKFLRVKMRSNPNGGAARVKLYNLFGDHNFTADDIGKTYRVTFDVRLDVAATTITYGIMNPLTFTSDAKYSGTAYYGSTLTHKNYTVGEWTTLSIDLPITRQVVNGQYGMLTIEWPIVKADAGTVGYLDIDNAHSVTLQNDISFGTVVASGFTAKLVHTHAYTNTPTAFALVDGTTDTYYENCGCGLLGTKTFTHTHSAPADVAVAKYLKTAGSCVTKTVYYQSCSSCGMALETTFTGDYSAHTPKSEPEADGSTLCSVCGAILTSPADTRWSTDGTSWTYASLPNALTALSGKTGYIEVMKNITANATVAIPASTSLTLRTYPLYHENLTVKRATTHTGNFITLGSGASLTVTGLTLSGSNVTPTVSGGCAILPAGTTVTLGEGAIAENFRTVNNGIGGAFRVMSGATLNLDGGIIRNCYARTGGAVCLDTGTGTAADKHAVLNMTAGSITGCNAGRAGGNTSDEWGSGGAVTIREYGVMNMSGGSITDNFGGRNALNSGMINDGGVNVFYGTSLLNISGDAVIYGNKAFGTDYKTVVASDIAFANNSNPKGLITVSADFTGLIGIRRCSATATDVGKLSGTTTAAAMTGIHDNQSLRIAKITADGYLSLTDSAAVVTVDGITDINDPAYRGERYFTLDEALAAVDCDGLTVTLGSNGNRTAFYTLPAHTFTIDGAGHTLKRTTNFADAMFRMEDGTNLTIRNLTLDGGSITVNSSETGATFRVGTGATLTMNSGCVIQNVVMTTSGSNRGGAVYLLPGATFTMNDGIIRNCLARSGGAIYCYNGTAANHPSVIIHGGIITGCRVGSDQAMGSAIFLGAYASVYMDGGLITGNSSVRRDYGGFSISVPTSNGTANAPKDEAADGAIAFREGTARVVLAGNATIRGNTTVNMQKPSETIDSDIGFFGANNAGVTIDSSFTGSVGIRYPLSTYTSTCELKPGVAVPANGANVVSANVIYTHTPVADGTVAVATASGFAEGKILGNVVDNSSAGKVAMVKNNKLVWTTAIAETDKDGIITRYTTFADAVTANKGPIKMLAFAEYCFNQYGETVSIDTGVYGIGLYTVSDDIVAVPISQEEFTPTYTYGGLTFSGKTMLVETYKALDGYINSASISAGTDLTLKLYASIAFNKRDGVRMRITLNPGAENETVKMIDGTAADEYGMTYVFAFTGITPQCMGDTVNAQLVYNGTDFGSALTGYSVADYCRDLLDLYQADTDMCRVISDLIVYGAAAQSFTNYKTDALVTAGFDSISAYAPTSGTVAEGTAMTLTAEIGENAAITTAGLEFSNVNRLYFKFKTDDIAKTSVTLNGVAAAPAPVAGTTDTYVIYTEALTARQFDDIYTVILSYAGESGTETQTLTYSVNNYAYRMQSSENVAMKALASATYFYGVSAENYR